MKRLGCLLVVTIGLLVASSNDACGIRWSARRARLPKRVTRRAPTLSVKRKASNPYVFIKGKRYIAYVPFQRSAVSARAPEISHSSFPRASAQALSPRAQRKLTQASLTAPMRRLFPTKGEVDAVIFDLDGTLLDSLWAWENSGSNFVRSRGIEPPANLDAQLETMSLMDGANLIKEMYNFPETPEQLLELTLLPIRNRYLYEIEPMPGVREQLAQLKAQGVKMAVATASHKEFAQAALERLGMSEYFEFIITCDEVGAGKTSPKVYEAALERLGTTKEHTLVAEDALYALETAHEAGFKTAAIEENHSFDQRAQKQAVADYYIISYEGLNTLAK